MATYNISVVAVKYGSKITNNRKIIAGLLDAGINIEFLDQKHMQFMAACDLGHNWEALGNSPVLFRLKIDDDTNKIVEALPPENF